MQYLSISCVFSCASNTASFRYSFTFRKIKNSYIKWRNYSSCKGYSCNKDETWFNRHCFYIRKNGVYDDGGKATERSPKNSLTRWIITYFKAFTRKGIEQVSRYVLANVY